MMTYADALKLAKGLENVTAHDHFGGIALKRKKNFATFWKDRNEVNVKLTSEEQEALCSESKAISPVEGGWGRMGWTKINLAKVTRKVFVWAIETAHSHA